jgi:D-alanine-D-alanine ligase
MKILVLGGGDSPERDVSLRSAKSIVEAANQAGFEVSVADPKSGLKALDGIPEDTVVFPILHGKGGEDGFIQKELEKRGLPYLGADSRSSVDCFDKWLTRQKLEQRAIPMPKAVLVTAESYSSQPLARQPHVLKVLRGGSSIGTLLIRQPQAVKKPRINELFELDKEAVLEELIDGLEITVPILDKTALPVIEIIPPKDEEFDYDNKYNGRTQEIVPAKSISMELQQEAQRLAEKVHSIMDARHLSRVDLMVDKQNKFYVLEINTIPGLTDQSLYPKAATAAGITMPQLVTIFIELVKRDYNL